MSHHQIEQIKYVDVVFDVKSLLHDIDSVKSLVCDEPQPLEAEIIRYLKQGTLLFFTPTSITDVLRDDAPHIGGASLMTDGRWLWREYLAYYVETYHFRLPSEFVIHAKSNDWQYPKLTRQQEQSLIETCRRCFEGAI